MRTYANVVSGVVVEIITPPLDPEGEQYPIEKCYPPEFIQGCVEITGIEPQPAESWTYDGETFTSPTIEPNTDQLTAQALAERDGQLRNIYDPAISKALRALRMATTAQEKASATVRVSKLDAYAEALDGLAEQPGFPKKIMWPVLEE